MTTDFQTQQAVDTFEVVKQIVAKYKNEGRVVNDIDGARVDFGSPGAPAWGLVRASNTQPALVMRCEAETAERLGLEFTLRGRGRPKKQ